MESQEGEGHTGSLPNHNAGRPSSTNVLAKLSAKRKAEHLEDSGPLLDASRICFPIKQEVGVLNDESHDCSDRGTRNGPEILATTSKSPVLVKKEHSLLDDEMPQPSSNDDRIESHAPRIFRGFKDAVAPRKREQNSHNGSSREISEDDSRASSSSGLTEPDIWDVSESEFRFPSDEEEDSSDGDDNESVFSLGMERQESEESMGSFKSTGSRVREQSKETSKGKTGSTKALKEVEAQAISGMGEETIRRSTASDPSCAASKESTEEPSEVDSRLVHTTKGLRRKRAPALSLINPPLKMPHSWKSANAADKMLVSMKDRGCDWKEIRLAWKELTGQMPALSTLPNRYNRIKTNLMRLKPGDDRRLLDAAAQVEAQFQRAKWRLIAETMTRAGAATYPKAFIQKKHDELSRHPNSNVAPQNSDVPDLYAHYGEPIKARKKARHSSESQNAHIVQPRSVYSFLENGGIGPVPDPTVKRRYIKNGSDARRPYECESCCRRYCQAEGLRSHYKNWPGCDPEKRQRKAAKKAAKEAAARDVLDRPVKVEGVEIPSIAPKPRVVIDISSKEPTPDVGGYQ